MAQVMSEQLALLDFQKGSGQAFKFIYAAVS
jgi:hypothetical protein